MVWDTRDTLVARLPEKRRVETNNEYGKDIPENLRPPPRFKTGDVLLMALRPDEPFTLASAPWWDYEFQGWLISPGLIGVHESNYLLMSERDDWEPHAAGLWSWWTRGA